MVVVDDTKYTNWQKMGVVPSGLPGLGFSFAENFHYSAASEPMKEISFANVIGIHTSPYTTTWKNPMQLFVRSEEHTSELQSLMRISYAVFSLKKKTSNE